MKLTRTHYLVLYCALDGLELATLLVGMNLMIGSGEEFTLVPPTPPDDARRATLELLEAGAITVSHFDSETSERRDLDQAEARRTLVDPTTWDLNASPPVAYQYELVVTATGQTTFDEAYELFGEETKRSLGEARARDAEFMRRHPDFVEKNARYLKALDRWLTWGGREPQPPRFD